MSEAAPILLVANMLPPVVGGTPMLYDRIARHSAPRLHVLTAWRDPDDARIIPGWREHDASAPYPIHRLPWLRPPRIEAFRRRIGLLDLILIDLPVMLFVFLAVVFHALRSGARTIVLGELQGLGWLAILLAILTPWRVVMYTHGEDVVQQGYNRLARLRGPALRASDIVITVSSFTRDRLVSDFAVPIERIRLVTPGVDVERFTPTGVREPFILSVGRLIERKGFDRLIEAFALIAPSFPQYRLKIAGNGAEKEALIALAQQGGHADRIDFVGGIGDAELTGLYQSCTLFSMPNRTLADGDTEGFGLVFLEANACGKPVVGGRAGGAVDAIIDGETGFSVRSEDPAAIAEAIARLLGEPATYDRMAKAALAHARAHDWEGSTRRFLDAVR